MKYMPLLLLALSLVWAGAALARDAELPAAIQKPMTIDGGTSERMSVVFNHTTHAKYKCALCHHESSGGDANVACAECHSTPGARERDPMSMFMAFHSKGSDRSCVGCHTKAAQDAPDAYAATFKGCRPCHLAPTARKAIEAARAASK